MTEEQLEFLRNHTGIPEEDYKYCVFNEHGVFTPKYDVEGNRIAAGEDSYNEYLNPPDKQPSQMEVLEKRVDKVETDNLDTLSTMFELDFRVMDIEDILMTVNPNTIEKLNMRGASKMALKPYEMAKTLILAGEYDKDDMEYKLGKYLERKRITEEEYKEALMDAQELIK